MNLSYNYSKLKELNFFSDDVSTEEEAKDYAQKQLSRGMYDGCLIAKLYVNNFLVGENVKVKK